MKVEIHDMRRTEDKPLDYRFVGIVEMAMVPRVGETVHHDSDDPGFVVKSVLHVVGGKPPQVRGW